MKTPASCCDVPPSSTGPQCNPCSVESADRCGQGAGDGMGCGKPCTSSWITAMGAAFHPSCFKCPTCAGPISGGFFPFNNCAFCTEECMSRYQEPDFVIGEPDEALAAKAAEKAAEESAAEPQEICGAGAGEGMGCGGDLAASRIGALGAKFCPECFKCPTCQKKIEGSFYGHADCAFDTPECIQIYVDEHGYER